MDAAAKVRCPAHLILAREDQMTPTRAAREIALALNAQTQVVVAGSTT